MDDERAIVYLEQSESLIKMGEWKSVENCLQKFYSCLPKKPILLIRALVVNAYLSSTCIPTDNESTNVKRVLVEVLFDEQKSHLIPQLVSTLNGISFLKNALELAALEKQESVFILLTCCFLDISYRFLFTHSSLLLPILSHIAPMSYKLSNQFSSEWIILLNLCHCYAILSPSKDSSNTPNKVEAKNAFKKALEHSTRSHQCLQVFYSFIKPLVSNLDVGDFYLDWQKDLALYLFISLYRLESDVLTQDQVALTSKERQEKLNELMNKVQSLISTPSLNELCSYPTTKEMFITLSLLFLKCQQPIQAKSLLKLVENAEYASKLYVLKQYALAELAFYELDESNPTMKIEKSIKIISSVCDALEAAFKNQLPFQIIQSGCLFIWNSSLPFFQSNSIYTLMSMLEKCTTFLENVSSPLFRIRCQMHYEISKYYYSQNLIKKAFEHAEKGLAVDLEDSHVREELQLLFQKIIGKSLQGYEPRDSNLDLIYTINKANEVQHLSLSCNLIHKALCQWIPNFENIQVIASASTVSADQDSVEITKQDITQLLLCFHVLEACTFKANYYTERLKKRNAITDVELLKSSIKNMWTLCICVCNFALSLPWLQLTKQTHYMRQKAKLHIIRAKSLQKVFYSQDPIHEEQEETLLNAKDAILFNLTESMDLGCTCQTDWIIYNSAVEIWNFYKTVLDPQSSTPLIEFTSCFQKGYDSLMNLKLKDSSLLLNFAATVVQFLLNQCKTTSTTAPTTADPKGKPPKGPAKPSKDDPNTLLLSKADEICQDALKRTNCNLESRLYLLHVWSSIATSKGANNEPITQLDDVNRLLSTMEILELSSLKQERQDFISLLQIAIFDTKTISNLSTRIKLETFLRILQLALCSGAFYESFGCVAQILNILKECNNEELEILKSRMELLNGQLICKLFESNLYYQHSKSMSVDAMKCFLSSLNFYIDAGIQDVSLIDKNMQGITFLCIKKAHELDLPKILESCKVLFSKYSTAVFKSPQEYKEENHIKSVEEFLEFILDLCISLKLIDIGILFCDFGEKLIVISPKIKDQIDLKRFKLLALVGKQSPLLKLSAEVMSKIWVEIAENQRTYGEKKKAYETCIKLSQGTCLEFDNSIVFAEWLCDLGYLTPEDYVVTKLKELYEAATGSQLLDMLLQLRYHSCIVRISESKQEVEESIRKSSELILSLLKETHRQCQSYVPPKPVEEVVEKDAKGAKGAKKGAKETASVVKPTTPIGEFPKKDEWINYSWPQTMHLFFLEKKASDILCVCSIPDRLVVIESLLNLVYAGLRKQPSLTLSPILKSIELLIGKDSKEVQSCVSLIEMDLLYKLDKRNEAKVAFKRFSKFRIPGLLGYKSNPSIVKNILIIQSKILFEHGILYESKALALESYQSAQMDKNIPIQDESLVMLSLVALMEGEYDKSQTLVSKVLCHASTAQLFTNAALFLFFSGCVKSETISMEQIHYLTACIDRLKDLNASHSTLNADHYVLLLLWIKLRLLIHVPELESSQKFESVTLVFEKCMQYCQGYSPIKRQIQIDYMKSLSLLIAVANKDLTRKIRNHSIRYIHPIEEEIKAKIYDLYTHDYELVLEMAEIELNDALHPNSFLESRTIEQVLDDFLLDLKDPQLSMSKESCLLMLEWNVEKIPKKLKARFHVLSAFYIESLGNVNGEQDDKISFHFSSAIPHLYESMENKELLKLLLEKLLEKQDACSPMFIKYLCQLQSIEPISYLKQQWISSKKLKTDLTILNVISPWFSTFTHIEPFKLYANCGNSRVENMIQWKFEIEFESIPKNNKILLLQHSRDMKYLYVGILKSKKNVKPSKTSTFEDLFDIYSTKVNVNVSLLKQVQKVIPEIRTSGKQVNSNTEENTNSNSFNLFKSYLSPLLEIPEVVNLLKEIKESNATAEVAVPTGKGGAKAQKAEPPKIIENEHTILLLDEFLEILPMESLLKDTLNTSSVSRDFSLTTYLERIKCLVKEETAPVVVQDTKKKDKGSAPPQEVDKSNPTLNSLSYITDEEEQYEWIQSVITKKKPTSKSLGISGSIGNMEMNQLILDFPVLLYSGKLFDSQLISNFKSIQGPRACLLFEHSRPKIYGTGHISISRQKELAALLTLSGIDSIILPNVSLSNSSFQMFLDKVVDGGEPGKLVISSISSFQHECALDICPIPQLLNYGINLKISI